MDNGRALLRMLVCGLYECQARAQYKQLEMYCNGRMKGCGAALVSCAW